MLYDYIVTLTNNHSLASKYMAIMNRMEVSIDMLAITVKLYNKIERMAIRKNGRKLYRCKSGGDLYIKRKNGHSNDIQAYSTATKQPAISPAKKAILQSLTDDPYQLLIVCTMIAAKYCRDIPFANESWAVISGISCAVISDRERQVLGILEYEIITEEENRIRTEIEPYLQNDPRDLARMEETNVVKIVKKIFCF